MQENDMESLLGCSDLELFLCEDVAIHHQAVITNCGIHQRYLNYHIRLFNITK